MDETITSAICTNDWPQKSSVYDITLPPLAAYWEAPRLLLTQLIDYNDAILLHDCPTSYADAFLGRHGDHDGLRRGVGRDAD